MTCSADGFNGMSRYFHDFINGHIVRGDWKGRERPILLNNWEAHFFQFTQGKLLHLARQAKRLGVELFVLDDGWFGKRDNDKAGLGDYTVNLKKLPRGLLHFARRVRKLGLDFGLWFEPEMISEDSDLYRTHPEYAVRTPGKTPTLGRNQLVLDMCNPVVRDHIVYSVGRILDEAGISYVKWDMNRHISDASSPTFVEKREIKSQIAFYKKHRRTLQFGRFYRLPALRGNKVHWQCMSGDGKSGVAGFFQTLSTASDGSDLLPLTALEPDARYTVATRPQFLQIKRFGGLIKHILPVPLNPGGIILRTANKFFCLMDCVGRHEGHGDLLMAGIRLASQFSGTGYHAGIRMPGDFGSYLYVIGKQED